MRKVHRRRRVGMRQTTQALHDGVAPRRVYLNSLDSAASTATTTMTLMDLLLPRNHLEAELFLTDPSPSHGPDLGHGHGRKGVPGTSYHSHHRLLDHHQTRHRV